MDELGFTRLYGKVCELKIKAEKAEKKKEEERVMKALAEEERLKRERKEQQEEAERKRQEELLMLKKGWENMLAIYKNLGGKVSEFKLKKNQVPSKSDIEQLTKATKELQKKRKEEEVVKVKEEIEPYKLSVLKFLENFEKFVQEDALSNGCVKVLGEFQSKVLEVVNEVFGKIQ
jgi:monoamine oxidase